MNRRPGSLPVAVIPDDGRQPVRRPRVVQDRLVIPHIRVNIPQPLQHRLISVPLGSIRIKQVDDLHRRPFLPDAVDPPDALLQRHRIPRNIVIHHRRAELQVQRFRCRFRADQQPPIRIPHRPDTLHAAAQRRVILPRQLRDVAVPQTRKPLRQIQHRIPELGKDHNFPMPLRHQPIQLPPQFAELGIPAFQPGGIARRPLQPRHTRRGQRRPRQRRIRVVLQLIIAQAGILPPGGDLRRPPLQPPFQVIAAGSGESPRRRPQPLAVGSHHEPQRRSVHPRRPGVHLPHQRIDFRIQPPFPIVHLDRHRMHPPVGNHRPDPPLPRIPPQRFRVWRDISRRAGLRSRISRAVSAIISGVSRWST